MTGPALALDPAAAEPLYLQVARLLAGEVAGGALVRGTRLPSERELCGRLGVSRVTLRRALAQLVDEGVLESVQGRGWYVTTGLLGEPPNTLQSFTETAQRRGLTASARVLLARVRAATLDEAEVLGVAPGVELFELHRVRLLSGVPLAFDEVLVPLAIAPGLPDHDFATASLYRTLQAAGTVPSRADYAVESAAADARAAELLDLALHAPVLITLQTTYDQSERVIERSRMTYRGDRYRFRASLTRAPSHPRKEPR
jgi:DNA-binding GntR family transcriptional regulator